MKLPYAIVNFSALRREQYFYADKTRFLALLEDKSRGRPYALFLRPRRFGKSTFLSLLEHYYDVARRDQFDALFSGLHVGRHPTAERNSYLVLKLDFSGLSTSAGVDALRLSFHAQLRSRLDAFFTYYQQILPAQSARWPSLALRAPTPADLMTEFLDLLVQAPHPLYVLIDEHDKFVNNLIARGDHDTYHKILSASGFVRDFYERLKAGTDSVLRRMFMTGVSPVMVNDLASGFNIAKPIYLLEEFNDLCGFSQGEVEELVDGVLADEPYTLSREALLADLRAYYDGYLFSERATERMYNPDMVLYFLSELRPPNLYPRQLLDMNVRTDHTRLHRLLFTHEGAPRPKAVEEVRTIVGGGTVASTVHDLFPLEQAYDEKFFTSYLYYLGLLTISGQERDQLRLSIPNVVIRELYGETLNYILKTVAQIQVDEDQLRASAAALAYDGDLLPLLTLIDGHVITRLSNRDLIKLDERVLKMLLLAYLSMTDVFYSFSEMELGRGYGDVILVLNRRYGEARYSVLLELKYLAQGEKKGATAKAGTAKKKQAAAKKKQAAAKKAPAARGKAAPVEPRVEAQFSEAEEQLRRYLEDPRLAGVRGPLGWKAFSVVQVGGTALYARELGQPTVILRR